MALSGSDVFGETLVAMKPGLKTQCPNGNQSSEQRSRPFLLATLLVVFFLDSLIVFKQTCINYAHAQ